MATLVSPGVEVTIIDESNYIPAATNSVPYILIATAQNKISGTGVGVAPGTLAANAGKVYLVTSQRDLSATFGVPFFYKTSAGTPINGYELNEYGLLAAYSALGISNRAYVQRANIDLAELTATLVRPTGSPNDGTYWLDTADTAWGIFQWNSTTGAFTVETPLVITDSAYLLNGVPVVDFGSIGNYAVVATNSANPVYFKNYANEWVLVGSDEWKQSWPTIQGANSYSGSSLTGSLIINGVTVTLNGDTVSSAATKINLAFASNVILAVADSSNKLNLYASSYAEPDGTTAQGGGIYIDSTSTASILNNLGLTAGQTFYTPHLQQSPNYTVPLWRSNNEFPRPTGSVWNQTNNVNRGTNVVIKKYSSTLGVFVTQNSPVYASDWAAIYALDPSGGGKNIPAGALYVQYDVSPIYDNSLSEYLNTFTLKAFERSQAGIMTATGSYTSGWAFANGDQFSISASQPGSATMSTPVTVTIAVSGSPTAADWVTAFSSAGVPNVVASVNSAGAIVIEHLQGGDIVLANVTGTPIQGVGLDDGAARTNPYGGWIFSNWVPLTYTASAVAPSQDPANGRLWYYSATDQVDVMIQNDGTWKGYRNVTNDVRGYNLYNTDPNGPQISVTAPTTQSDGSPLVYGDLWLDTSNLEIYPVLNRWEQVDGVNQWVTIDNTDQTTSNGILFADARWAPNGTTNPITDPYPSITSLLQSNYLDLDAPDPTLFPAGTLLWNTRRSGFNVKKFESGYFNGTSFSVPQYSNTTAYVVGNKVIYNAVIYVCIQNSTGNTPTNTSYWSELQTNAWVTASGNQASGAPYMGRKAVRQIVVAALKSAIDTQDTLREEQEQFNLIACPQYPELIPNMVALNNERSNTAFVIGDTPLRLGPDGNGLASWATNANGMNTDSEMGLVTSDPYLGVFYPSCQTTDLSGAIVVQPPSHMMIRTIIRSDEVSYPWLAPAGVRRGVIDNASRIGYVNGQTGEFVTIATGQAIRDVLYQNKINPITFIPGVGITNYGNKTESAVTSALDRINVARLVAFIRGRLNEIGKTFVFEPNDQITRNEITNAINGLMIDLVAKRGIYDYLVVCDLSNNTPARIDANELWVDIAIEPVKAVEFIYIPVRIKNTGEIAAGQVAPSATV